MPFSGVGRSLVVAGVVLLVIGVLILLLERVGIPRLPGDIVIRRGNWTIYIPIATSILLSLILTLLFALFRR
ncbi:MAG: DUF2905 family protein [Limnochordales bacterium]|nr:MAG: DUF2905 domain-containing protein [Bacillota bacterium]